MPRDLSALPSPRHPKARGEARGIPIHPSRVAGERWRAEHAEILAKEQQRGLRLVGLSADDLPALPPPMRWHISAGVLKVDDPRLPQGQRRAEAAPAVLGAPDWTVRVWDAHPRAFVTCANACAALHYLTRRVRAWEARDA